MPFKKAHADVSPCSAISSPGQVASDSDVTVQFTLTNGGGNSPIRRILLTTPASSFTIKSLNATGWNSEINESGAVFFNNSLAADNTISLSVTVQTGDFIDGEINWGIYSFDGNSPSGYGSIVCQNSTTLFMDDNTPHISDVTVGSVTPKSVSVTWTTTLPSSSQVIYGPSSNYGMTSALSGEAVIKHTVILQGLTPNTAYHYQVKSGTSASKFDTSGDGTFITAMELPPVIKTVNIPGLSVIITNPNDNTPPTITLNTLVSQQVYKTAPTIQAVANDDVSVARVEYSINSGKDWLPADTMAGLGTKRVNFSFTPLGLDDGNYTLVARVLDGGGNTTTTTPFTIVIDRLPPIVGGCVLSLGSQILSSTDSGIIQSMVGIDEKITLSAVGGPTSITLRILSADNKETGKSFSLTNASDSGLWSGIISFANAGTYTLAAYAVDGAGNKTVKILNTIDVAAPAKILDNSAKPVRALVTAYYLVPETNSWVIWDAAAYGQNNPQKSSKDGNFELFMPAGTFYLKATGSTISTIVSTVFKLANPTPLSIQLTASGGKDLIHSLFSRFSTTPVTISSSRSKKSAKDSLIGGQVPDFALIGTTGKIVHSVDLVGRPTLLTFMSNWAPTTSEQLPALDELSHNKGFNINPIALQENAGKMRAYQAISGYSLPWLADPDSTTSDIFNITSLPTHYFVDREGKIKKVITGVLSKSELLDTLSSL